MSKNLTKNSKPSIVVKHWITALRSGKYRQGHFWLKSEQARGAKYCCLGVLCDLAKKAGVIDVFYSKEAFLPEKVKKWAGLTRVDGRYDNTSLVARNDIAGDDFDQIADIIESKPDRLFVK